MLRAITEVHIVVVRGDIPMNPAAETRRQTCGSEPSHRPKRVAQSDTRVSDPPRLKLLVP